VAYCQGRIAPNSIYGVLHRECHNLFPDRMFADLFADVGRRSVPPMIVAVVMVLQRFDGLSDREAVDRFAFDARWKYAAGGLDFDHPGFVHTVLVDTRARLARSDRPNRIFEVTLEVAKRAGLVGRKRVVDSTPIYDAVATMDTVTLIRSAIRGLLRAAGPRLEAELRGLLARGDDYAEAGKPVCDWEDRAAREALVDALARDAMALLGGLDGRAVGLEVVEAAALLATVVGQDLDTGEDGAFRIARRVAKDRVISTVDPQTRHGHKTSARGFDGYKGHVAADPDSEIITDTEVSPGNTGDATVAEDLIDDLLDNANDEASDDPADEATDVATDEATDVATDEASDDPADAASDGPAEVGGSGARPAWLPAAAGTSRDQDTRGEDAANGRPAVYGDAAYGSGEFLDRLAEAGIDSWCKTQPPGAASGMFTKDRFEVDLDQDTVTCPAGNTAPIRRDAHGDGVAYFADNCAGCPLRDQCTNAKGGRTIRVGRHEQRLAEARARQQHPDWIADYRATRPKVERKIGHLMRRRHGGRRARVRGQHKVAADFSLLAAACNIARLATLGLRSTRTGWAVTST
jgi:hypothetical protein